MHLAVKVDVKLRNSRFLAEGNYSRSNKRRYSDSKPDYGSIYRHNRFAIQFVELLIRLTPRKTGYSIGEEKFQFLSASLGMNNNQIVYFSTHKTEFDQVH